jgi:hypothetical protein
MTSSRPAIRATERRKAPLRVVFMPRRIILRDHERLPWRFFGRLTASAQAGL